MSLTVVEDLRMLPGSRAQHRNRPQSPGEGVMKRNWMSAMARGLRDCWAMIGSASILSVGRATERCRSLRHRQLDDLLQRRAVVRLRRRRGRTPVPAAPRERFRPSADARRLAQERRRGS